MAIRQEQIVLIGTALLLGYMFFTSDAGERKVGTSRPKAPKFEDHFAPDVDLATAQDRDVQALQREMFSAPTDTRPFPELAFEMPLLEPLESLRPPPSAGPEPKLYGRFLRSAMPSNALQGLFLKAEEEEDLDGENEFALGASTDNAELTAEERQALFASYKAEYDWVHTSKYHFGYIRNPKRYTLSERPDEPILFMTVDPATGRENSLTKAPIPFERSRIHEFGFAGTVDNSLELERGNFVGELTVGQYPAAFTFALKALRHGQQSPRALEIAKEMFTRASPLTVEDPGAQLGLAGCAEVAYEFEAAFEIYEKLVAGRFSKHPVVLTRLAELEARFRMTGRARAHLEQATRFGRSEWYAQWKHGRFLLDAGESVEAVEHLRRAVEFEPKAPEFQVVRGRIRTDLGEALVAVGDLDGAQSLFDQALRADEASQRAQAGNLALAYLRGGAAADLANSSLEVSEGDATGSGFDLLMAQGLSALEAGEYPVAMERLELAAVADPLRAYIPWRALSYLAELTSNQAEAMEFADKAQANNPTDIYSLYQRGRVLAQNGDSEGALESLTKSLDLELDLPDALAAIGRLEMEAGNHERADRFLERATQVDPGLGSAFTTRGLNCLHLQRAEEAKRYFDEALAKNVGDPVAAIGQAWCVYSLGDPTEAKTLLREFEDSRRNLGDEDAYRIYANEQIERIGEWEEKVVWSDHFERQDVRNSWLFDEVPEVLISAREGAVVMDGSFDKTGRVRLKRTYTAGDFVSLQAKLTIRAGTSVRCGIFVGMENRRGSRSTPEVTAEVTVSRHGIEKKAQYRAERRNQEAPYVDVDVMKWEDEQTVLLKLERYGESGQTAFRVYIDGVLVNDRLPAAAMGQTTREVVVGVFSDGEPGRKVLLQIDDVEIVKRQR